MQQPPTLSLYDPPAYAALLEREREDRFKAALAPLAAAWAAFTGDEPLWDFFSPLDAPTSGVPSGVYLARVYGPGCGLRATATTLEGLRDQVAWVHRTAAASSKAPAAVLDAITTFERLEP